ncbi:MAG: hypothetical protein V1735_06820 [Nanoarchaeota archaeon]
MAKEVGVSRMTVTIDGWDFGSMRRSLSAREPRPSLEQLLPDEIPFDEMGKAGLEKFAVYEAIHLGSSGRTSSDDSQEDPLVAIEGPDGKYYGRMIFSTSSTKPRRAAQANNIREDLIWDVRDNRKGKRVRVKCISNQKSWLGTPDDPYTVTGTAEAIHGVSDTLIESVPPFTAEDAHAVVIGDKVFYGQVLPKYETGRVGARILVYDRFGNPHRGFLKPTESRRFNLNRERMFAESVVTGELIDKLKPGDFVLAREIARNPDQSVWFFNYVVNIDSLDNTMSPQGERLETVVEGYKPGQMIRNLPIHTAGETRRFEPVGIGHVARPSGDGKNFFLKPVFVLGAEGNVGRYAPQAEIITNGTGIILARLR